MSKVLLINGSPQENGCIYTVLDKTSDMLQEEGVQTEIFQIGAGAVHGCLRCGQCKKTGSCIFTDDVCNEMAEKMCEADGIIIGAPVYSPMVNGALIALLDRVFYSRSGHFREKYAACIAGCRTDEHLSEADGHPRREISANNALEAMNSYFLMCGMTVVHSGVKAPFFFHDKDGFQNRTETFHTLKKLSRNMAWLLAEKDAGVQKIFNS